MGTSEASETNREDVVAARIETMRIAQHVQATKGMVWETDRAEERGRRYRSCTFRDPRHEAHATMCDVTQCREVARE